MWYDTRKMAKEVEAQRERFGNLPPDMQKERFQEEAEAGWAKIEACVLQFKAGANILSGGRFDTLSLGTWMEIVKAADLTYVPAEIVALPKTMQFFTSSFAPVELDIRPDLLQYRGMVRMDNCGSEALKMQMGVRGSHEPEGRIVGALERDGKWLFAFDDRTVHGAMEYVGQIERDGDVVQPIWWRPWVKAIQVSVPRPKFMGGGFDTWPLEWRVIVQAGKVAGISSYYPQAPVAVSDEIVVHVGQVLAESNKLLTFMRDRGIQPWHPRYIDALPENEVAFSFDFISTPQGPAFLEAGPAVPVDDQNIPVEVWGAHPCNFLGRKVAGVALNKTDSIPLSEFSQPQGA